MVRSAKILRRHRCWKHIKGTVLQIYKFNRVSRKMEKMIFCDTCGKMFER